MTDELIMAPFMKRVVTAIDDPLLQEEIFRGFIEAKRYKIPDEYYSKSFQLKEGPFSIPEDLVLIESPSKAESTANITLLSNEINLDFQGKLIIDKFPKDAAIVRFVMCSFTRHKNQDVSYIVAGYCARRIQDFTMIMPSIYFSAGFSPPESIMGLFHENIASHIQFFISYLQETVC